jgi:CRISPR/Cas system-associated exonuclease Cas4 (RecB family)
MRDNGNRIEIDCRYVLDLERPVERIGVIDLICPRRAWRVYRMPVRALVERVNEFMVQGQVVHDVLLAQLKEQGCSVEHVIEVETRCGVRRKFRADAVCHDIVIELKRSARQWSVWKYLYLWQLKVYMALTGRRRGALVSLEDGRVEYVEYAGAESRHLDEVLERFIDHLNKAVCSEREPERHIGVWCRYCELRRECFNGRLV